MISAITAVLYSDQVIAANEKVDQHLLSLLGPSRRRIGYVASGPDPERRFFSDKRSYYARCGLELSLFHDLDIAGDPRELFACDAIHLSGGNTAAFLARLRHSSLLGPLKNWAARGGILIGTSAGAILMTPPEVTRQVVRDCSEAHVPRVWMHRAAGRGAVSEEGVAFCREHGMEVIAGECPFMFLPDAGAVHSTHAAWRRALGTYPRTARNRRPHYGVLFLFGVLAWLLCAGAMAFFLVELPLSWALALNALLAPWLGRPADQVDPIEKSILWIAAWELTESKDVPWRVAINEAIELAKRFGAEQSHKFVNGVLDKSVQQR